MLPVSTIDLSHGDLALTSLNLSTAEFVALRRITRIQGVCTVVARHGLLRWVTPLAKQ